MHVLLTEIGLPCCLCNQAKILGDVIDVVESSSACALVPKTAQGLKYKKITL